MFDIKGQFIPSLRIVEIYSFLPTENVHPLNSGIAQNHIYTKSRFFLNSDSDENIHRELTDDWF